MQLQVTNALLTEDTRCMKRKVWSRVHLGFIAV